MHTLHKPHIIHPTLFALVLSLALALPLSARIRISGEAKGVRGGKGGQVEIKGCPNWGPNPDDFVAQGARDLVSDIELQGSASAAAPQPFWYNQVRSPSWSSLHKITVRGHVEIHCRGAFQAEVVGDFRGGAVSVTVHAGPSSAPGQADDSEDGIDHQIDLSLTPGDNDAMRDGGRFVLITNDCGAIFDSFVPHHFIDPLDPLDLRGGAGEPGQAGGAGGSLFIQTPGASYLQCVASGGRGGNGQEGAPAGSAGGEGGRIAIHARTASSFFGWMECRGGKGGAAWDEGSDGGAGGKGGQIVLVDMRDGASHLDPDVSGGRGGYSGSEPSDKGPVGRGGDGGDAGAIRIELQPSEGTEYYDAFDAFANGGSGETGQSAGGRGGHGGRIEVTLAWDASGSENTATARGGAGASAQWMRYDARDDTTIAGGPGGDGGSGGVVVLPGSLLSETEDVDTAGGDGSHGGLGSVGKRAGTEGADGGRGGHGGASGSLNGLTHSIGGKPGFGAGGRGGRDGAPCSDESDLPKDGGNGGKGGAGGDSPSAGITPGLGGAGGQPGRAKDDGACGKHGEAGEAGQDGRLMSSAPANPPTAWQPDFSDTRCTNPPIVFIPGIAASVLTRGSEELWPAVFSPDAAIRQLKLPPSGVSSSDIAATDVIRRFYEDVYGPFLEHLAKLGYVEFDIKGDASRLTSPAAFDPLSYRHAPTLFPFPYDWRLSNAISAQRLATYIDNIRRLHPEAGAQVVAHSMGGLVLRRYTLDGGSASIERAVTINTPYWGAPVATYRMLAGGFFNSGLIDWLNNAAITEVLPTFPGFHQLLPSPTYFAQNFTGIPVLAEAGFLLSGPGVSVAEYENFLRSIAPDYAIYANNKAFHSTVQDDGRLGPSGPPFLHLVGVQHGATTVLGVAMRNQCFTSFNEHKNPCTRYLQQLMGPGDGTVPFLSATRNSEALAEPGSVQRIMQGDTDVEHTAMVSNPLTWEWLHTFLGGTNLPKEPADTTPFARVAMARNTAATAGSYLVTIAGRQRVSIATPNANGEFLPALYGADFLYFPSAMEVGLAAADTMLPSVSFQVSASKELLISDLLSDLGLDELLLAFLAGNGGVPTLDDLPPAIAEQIARLLADHGTSLTSLLFGGKQLEIEILKEDGTGRFVELLRYELAPPDSAPGSRLPRWELHLLPGAAPSLWVDRNADRVPQASELLVPTVRAASATGVDLTPPELTLQTASDTRATLTASDNVSHNVRIFVGSDGGRFTAYTPGQPIPTGPTGKIRAYAVDELGNSSRMLEATITPGGTTAQFPSGNFNGLLEATNDSPNPINHSGLVMVDLSPTGAFTGKVMISGTSFSFKGRFLEDGSARFGLLPSPTLELVKPAKVSLGHLALRLDKAGTGIIAGTLTQGGTTVAALNRANPAPYTAKKNPVAPYKNVPVTLSDPLGDKGKYTALFRASTAPNYGLPADAFPQGDGWANVTILQSGSVKVVGKLADGSTVSYSNALSDLNEVPVYVPLHGAKGFLAGRVLFDPTQQETDATGDDLKWFKPANSKDAAYPNGWPAGIDLEFAASKFVPPTARSRANPAPLFVLGTHNVLGLAPGAFAIAIAGGGTPGFAQSATVDAKSKMTISAVGAPNLKAALSASTGALTGSFTHPGNNKSVPFSGVVLQKTHTAGGYFLYFPPKLRGQPTLPGSSGSISIVPTP